MNEIKPNPYLVFNKNQLQEVRKVFGYEDVRVLNQVLDGIEQWIAKQNHFTVRKFDRDYLERFLMYCKGSAEKTKHKLDKLCTARFLLKEFFSNFNMKEEFGTLFTMARIIILPKPTTDHHRIFLFEFHGDSYAQYTHMSTARYWISLLEFLLTQDYAAGAIWVCDARKINYELITKMNPLIVQKAITIVTETYAMRLQKIYLINSSRFLNTLLMMLKQALPEKLKSRIEVLGSPEELVEGHIDRELLPADYGGHLKCIADLADESFKAVCSEAHILRMRTAAAEATNEACRSHTRFNQDILGMPGSFKTFSVD
ncbi:hypothetical protein JYU34_011926 [Plutella xylostella]|uniref:CRAL-TRIO domain-containing protein n=1 Tax=Plutella xylostella TaxID=51655 RepID=A0ABQ7QEC7_PLUXY|nr:hypothetical protein JYU34_011926 [Plutella xylostella]